MIDLVKESIAGTLLQSSVDVERIDTLIFTTESFWDLGDIPSASILGVLCDLGLEHARPVGLWLSGCANVITAVRCAADMISAGSSENVLLVAAERVAPAESRMLMSPLPAAILSDAALSCIISSQRTDGYIVGATVHVSDLSWSKEKSSKARALRMTRSLRSLAQDYERQAGRSVDSYGCVVTPNYYTWFLQPMLEMIGVDPANIFDPTKTEIAHAFSMDVLMNLTHVPPLSEPCLVFAAGPYSWHLIELTPR